ncbi:hypothetical protein B6U79_02615 [Candidatus Bathyarchaeota archaeon ex4484_231]|nr:MAG: hypothetical protein B6U79_02615 [Candidatus Bathyarchaeota archaeon ex4484_231]
MTTKTNRFNPKLVLLIIAFAPEFIYFNRCFAHIKLFKLNVNYLHVQAWISHPSLRQPLINHITYDFPLLTF